MEYNTSIEPIKIPEYGRNIQKLIEFAMTIEDRQKRTKFCEYIVSIMAKFNNQRRDSEEYKNKLWDHLYIISDYKLDVDSPYPKPEIKNKKSMVVKKLDYPDYNIKYKHYGRIIEKIINKINEKGGERDIDDKTIKSIISYMKRVYNLWNKETINEESIIEHIKEISNNRMVITKKDKK